MGKHTKTALLLIDLVTDFNFEDGEKLFSNVASVAHNILRLKKLCVQAGHAVIYVNDNYGKWQEDFRTQVDRICDQPGPIASLVEKLRPAGEDYYVLKPHRSAFFMTPLAAILASLDIKRLILAGQTTDICITFTANDAYMRKFELVIPSDCSAAVEIQDHDAAIEFLRRVCDADTRTSRTIFSR